MQADQRYKQWIDSKHPPDIPSDFTDAVMQGVRTHAHKRRFWRLDVLVDQWCSSLWTRIAAVTGGIVVCVLRIVVLFLAALG
jgi:hypothetical protein